jgi:predicted DNA-binding transcriptional regulator YafY
VYHPTSRVLTTLEILQTRAIVSGTELAARLEVDARTVRSYITMLRDMGIPVEARPGRHGGYRLRPGFRLPPMMLTNEEAVAVSLGLLFARRIGLADATSATEGALAKIERVLPGALRAQVHALATALILDPPDAASRGITYSPIPSTTILLTLVAAAAEQQQVTLTYRDWGGTVTTRRYDPYAVVYPANAAWYVVGYCHLRDDRRVFRIDRVIAVAATETRFARPTTFDALAHVRRALALLPARWTVELVLQASYVEAEQWAAPLFATLSEECGETLLRCTVTDLDWLARTLVSMPFPFRIHTPAELLDALERVQAQIARTIAASRRERSPH